MVDDSNVEAPAESTSLADRRLLLYSAANFGTQATQATITAFLPVLLAQRLGAGALLIGVVLAIGRLASFGIQVALGVWGDATQSRWGRWLPYMVIAAPLIVLSLAGVALTDHSVPLVLWICLLFASLSLFMNPYLASLSEVVPAAQHTRATAWQSVFKGLGILLVFSLGAWLSRQSLAKPFLFTAGCLALSAPLTLGAMLGRTEPPPTPTREPLWPFLRRAQALRRLLLAHFCWWGALYVLFAYVVLFLTTEVQGQADLSTPAGQAAIARSVSLLILFALTTIVVAMPIGRLAQSRGKAPVMLGCLAVMMGGFALCFTMTRFDTGYLAAVLCGVGYGAILVIPYAWMVELRPPGREGALSSIFNVVTDLPQLAIVPLVGWTIDLAESYRIAFGWVLALTLAGALLLPRRARHDDLP